MKIAYLSNGESVHDQKNLSKMVEYGHEPYLISYFGNNLVEVEGVKVYKFNYRKLYRVNRFITALLDRTPFLGFQFSKKVLSFQSAYHLKKILKKIKPDILHTNFIQYEGFIGALTGFRPTISMPWGSDVLIYPNDSLLILLMTKYTLKQADMIQCDANVVKEKIMEIAKIPERNIQIFPQLGIDLNKFNPDNKDNSIISQLGLDGETILIMTRAFKPVYGIEYFLEALVIIVKEVDLRVIMCGDGPLREKFESFTRNNGIAKHVRFIGSVNNEELPHYLNVADIYVSTSLSDGTSLSLLEAMACGLPIVVTDVHANLEWIQDGYNGYVVPRKDSEILAEKIIELSKSKKIRQKFGERNINIAKRKANINENFEKLEEIYKKLVVVNYA